MASATRVEARGWSAKVAQPQSGSLSFMTTTAAPSGAATASPGGVLGGGVERLVRQLAFEVIVDGRPHPGRTRPAADAPDRQRWTDRGRSGRREARGQAPQGRPRARDLCPPGVASTHSLADPEGSLTALPRRGGELVSTEPPPGGVILVDRDLGRGELQQLVRVRERLRCGRIRRSRPFRSRGRRRRSGRPDGGRRGRGRSRLSPDEPSSSRTDCRRTGTRRASRHPRWSPRGPGCARPASAS